MKVLIVSTSDSGGAGASAIRLHQSLLKRQVDSKVLLLSKSRNIPETYLFRLKKKDGFSRIFRRFTSEFNKLYSRRLLNRQKEFIKSRPQGLEYFSFPNSGFDITESALYEEADIINLHWVANFLDYRSFFEKNKKPVVWTLHDMNPFSGGEHYEEDYLGVDDSGYPLSRKRSLKEEKVTKEIIALKSKAVGLQKNIIIVAPSKWLQTQASGSQALKNIPVFHVPYDLNEEVFYPYDQNEAKISFGIPIDKKVILFVSDFITNQRKGMIYLQKALEQIPLGGTVCCAVGKSVFEHNYFPNTMPLGHIKDEKRMAMAYAMADVFVIPSLMDNLPNTVLESLFCGTPVICFPVGGIVDMIDHKKNGLLTEEVSVSSLRDSLNDFMNNKYSFDRKQIRKEALLKYASGKQADAYIKLLNQLKP